jgi:ABC-2 type transport system permease protein
MTRIDQPAAPPLTTLTLAELRKMTDTRAGRWLLGVIALIGVAMVVVVVFAAPPAERTVRDLYSGALTGVAVLLPILGVLSVTGEWSQRTALTTFTLVPRRHRVILAKLAAAAVLGALALTVAVLTAWAGRVLAAVAGRAQGGWAVPPAMVASTLLFCLVSLSIGVAFGMVFRSSPLAIVLYFLLPLVLTILGENIRVLERAAGWLDINQTLNPLFESGITAGQWARIGTSLGLWLVLPLAAGVIRVLRAEVK